MASAKAGKAAAPVETQAEDTQVSEAIPEPETCEAIFMPTAYCSRCGVMLQGGSATSPSLRHYYHPFTAGKNGQMCELKGRKFRPMRAGLEEMS